MSELRKRIVFYTTQAEDVPDLRRYTEDIIEDIIEVVNGTVAPEFALISSPPKNPRNGTTYFASGWTEIGNGILNDPDEFNKGWNPLIVGDFTGGALKDGRGLWIYDDAWVNIVDLDI